MSALSYDHSLRLKIRPWLTTINRLHPQLNHRRQWVTTDASNAGDTLGVDKDRSALFQDRLHREGRAVGELIIGDPEVIGQATRDELTQVRRDLLHLEPAAAAPAERAIKVERVHPRFTHLWITS